MRGLLILLGAAAAGFIGLAGPVATSADARTVCRSEQVCTRPPPVRQTVRTCRMVRPAPGMAARRVCTSEVRTVRRGPPRCATRRVCRTY